MSFILILVCHAIFYASQPSFIRRWEFLNLHEVKLNSITFQLYELLSENHLLNQKSSFAKQSPFQYTDMHWYIYKFIFCFNHS